MTEMVTKLISIVNRKLTNFLKHFVALVKDEDLKVREVEVTTLYKLEDSAWSAYDDVWLLASLKEGHMVVQGDTAINDLSADIWHLALESNELFFDLVGEFSIMTKNKSRAGLRIDWKLM